jgi:L-fuconolactonase
MTPAVQSLDAHHHTWDLGRRAQPWVAGHPALQRSFGVGELESEYARAGIVGSVVVQNLCEEGETIDLLELAESSRTIRGVVGWTDLTGQTAAGIRRLRAAIGGVHLVGIRHQVQFETESDWLLRSGAIEGLAALAEAGLAFDAVVRADQLGSVVEVARAVPDVRIIVDHLGNPATESVGWQEHMDALAHLPNVAVKLSALTALARALGVGALQPLVDTVLQAFGAHRVMFGSDWPVCLLAGDFGDVVDLAATLTASLDEAERAEVFGGTAARWYGLP